MNRLPSSDRGSRRNCTGQMQFPTPERAGLEKNAAESLRVGGVGKQILFATMNEYGHVFVYKITRDLANYSL